VSQLVIAGGRARAQAWSGLASRLAWPQPKSEALVLSGVLLLIFAGNLVQLGSVIVADMDEGTYLYAGKLVAEGQLPYRDFLLVHPPLIAILTGVWERLFGSDIMPARIAFMLTVLASTAPLYAVTRALARSRLAGLLSVSVYTAGMLLLANMGRTVRLEPLMNACLIGAFACYLLRPDSLRARTATGALLAAAVLVKLVAVVPAGLLVVGDLVWARPGRRFIRSWSTAALGAALVLAAAAPLVLQPGFVDAVVRSQFERPGLPLEVRLAFVRQDVLRYPVIPLALLAAAAFLVKARDARLRVVSLVALGATLVLVVAFRTFYGYYLVQVLPWMAVVFAAAVVPLAQRLAGRYSRVVLLAGTLVFAGLLPPVYGVAYARTGYHAASPARIVPLLRGGQGYVYSMYPSFALWARRDPYPWYYAADSLIPRITGRIGDEEFVRVFAGSQALVTEAEELADLPRARGYAEEHFAIAYQDEFWTLWLRRDGVADREEQGA
jgi:hypothetical protein